MLTIEHSVHWIENGADYLVFASAACWLLCAVLCVAFLPSRDTPSNADTPAGPWLAAALAFLGLAAAAFTAVLANNGRTWPGLLNFRDPAFAITGLSTLLLLVLAEEPQSPATMRGTSRRVLIIVLMTLPLLQGQIWPDARPWGTALMYGSIGTWLLVRATRRQHGDGLDSHEGAGAVLRIPGIALITLGGAAAVAVFTPSAAPKAVVLGLGAAGTGGALWQHYLRERVLTQARRRRGAFGLRPAGMLPLVQGVVLAAGFLAQYVAVQQAEAFSIDRLVDEVRAVTTTIADELPAPPRASDPAGENARAAAWLEKLLTASPMYRAARLARTDDSAGHVTMRFTAGAEAAAAALAIHSLGERDGTRSGETFVRWNPPERSTDLIVVTLPVASGAADRPLWRLTVAVQARGLAEIIVSRRLQTLAIVALVALIVSAVVLALVRSQNETELRLLKERAELETHARNELLAMVSHEVRTPLQSVLGYAELAAMEPLPAAAERHIRAIRGQSAALLRIVQDILDLSALRSGRLELQPEPVALPALAGEVRHALAERARRKGLALTIHVADTVPTLVMVDRVRLLQVLLNLVSNAIKFTVRGGVRLTIRPAEENAVPTTRRLEFCIEDTGPGIPALQLRRVFEPFRKLRDDGAASSGVGLGLAICEQIVNSLGGRIHVESTEGAGATFRVELELPVAPADGTPGPHETTDGALDFDANLLTGLRVLLVDDHPLVRDLLRDALQRLGAHVTACADGATALEAGAQARPDVVLLDLKLPDCTPAVMLAGLRRPDGAPHEPWIVGLSAGATGEQVQAAFDAGMNDFLLKPVSIAGLAETLRLSPAGAHIKTEGARGPEPSNPRAPTPDERAALLAEAAPALVRIAHACHVGDADRAAAEAHFLANSCLALGLHVAHGICRTIEDAAEQEDLLAARAALADLRREIARAPGEEPSRAG